MLLAIDAGNTNIVFAVYDGDQVKAQFRASTKDTRTADEYYDFFAAKAGVSRDEAERSKGVSSGDFYATWYEAPNDPVHIHDQSHVAVAQNRRAAHSSHVPTEPAERLDNHLVFADQTVYH